MTEDRFYYNVHAARDVAVLDTAEQALDYAAQRVYFTPATREAFLAKIRNGESVGYYYGFEYASIAPVRRRRI